MMVLGLSLALVATQALSPLDVEGFWLTDDRSSLIKVEEKDDSVIGTVVWYEGMQENPLRDKENPDPALRDRPVLGLEFIKGFEKSPKKWRRGEIYNPETGQTFRSALERKDADTLLVQGCAAFICRKLEWTWIPPEQLRGLEVKADRGAPGEPVSAE